jgi:hypothetical protein
MGSTLPLQKIRTFDEAVTALGGNSNAARLLGRTPQQLSKYRNRGARFPASAFPDVLKVLAERGFEIPLRLFKFDRRVA